MMSLLALALVAPLAGCSFFHRDKGDAYRQSAQERPLEVPPDLDTPNSSSALVIPPAPGAATTSSTTDAAIPPAATPADGAAPPPAVAGVPGVSLSGEGLLVADTPASTWKRVGLALERSGAATIATRDESGATYTVNTTGQTTTRPGWFKRAITFGRASNKVTARVQLTVRVSADAGGSRVAIEGASDEASRDAAQALLRTLRERLS
jgi:uncharacterized lipoprotein